MEGVVAVRRIMLLIVVVALMAAITVVGTPLAAMAQSPPCSYNYCDWYQGQTCTWQYWGWDPTDGWTLIDSDGSC
jgi:hypothetical protein